MGKSDAPAPPDYKGQALATANSGKYNEVGPYGSVGWSLRPGADPNNPQPGDYIRSTSLSPDQQKLFDLGTQNQLLLGQEGQRQLGDLSGGRQAVQDALYKRTTRYYDQQFGDQEAAMRARLENTGLAPGSEAYNKELRNFTQFKNDSYGDAADRAVLAGDQSQNSAVQRLAQIMALSRGQVPTSSNSSGGAPTDFMGASQGLYNAQMGQVNADNAQAAGTTAGLSSLAMAAAIYF